MSTTMVTIGVVRQGIGGPMAVLGSTPRYKEKVTSGVGSVATTITIDNLDKDGGAGQIWEVSAVDHAIYVKFGSAPTASAGNDWYIPSGQTRWFGGVTGDKIAIIEA